MDDKDIVALYENRDENALIETEDRYGKYCFSIAINLLGDTREAEEVVNDAFYHTWESIPPQKPSNLKAFVGKVTRNLCINRIEAQQANKRRFGLTLVFDELEEVISTENEALIDKIALKNAIKAFLAELQKSDRILFVKRYWYNESIASLAKWQHVTKSAIKTKLHRLRQQLKTHLKIHGIQ